MRDEPWSSNELLFVLQSLPLRADGREPEEARRLRFQFVGDNGILVFGGTSAITFASTTCRVTTPPTNRPQEGCLRVVFGTSPGGSERTLLDQSDAPSFSEEAIFLERVLRDARCIDPESLCIVAGKYAFEVVVQVCALSLDGNVLSFASLAALGSLGRCRRPDFTVHRLAMGEEHVQLFHPKERPPIPLQLQAHPLIVEYALFFDYRRGSDDTFFLLDPTQREENACHSRLRILYDPKHERLLAVRKLAGGYAAVTSLPVLMRCIRRAKVNADANWKALYARLRAHEQRQEVTSDPVWTLTTMQREPAMDVLTPGTTAKYATTGFCPNPERTAQQGAPAVASSFMNASSMELSKESIERRQNPTVARPEAIVNTASSERHVQAADTKRPRSNEETKRDTTFSFTYATEQVTATDHQAKTGWDHGTPDGMREYPSAASTEETRLETAPRLDVGSNTCFQAGTGDGQALAAADAPSLSLDYDLSSDDSEESVEEQMQDLTRAARFPVPGRPRPQHR